MFKTFVIAIGVVLLCTGAYLSFESVRKVSQMRDWIKKSDLFHNLSQSRGYHFGEEDQKLMELLYYWGLTLIMSGVIVSFIATRL